MDTRFWGPSGWKLLHLISFDYTYSADRAITYAKFFETIPYILPCKFCRASLTDYYQEHPYTHSALTNGHMNPLLDVKKWMYTIHNCVNDKLRKQGLYKDANPSFASVKKRYTALLSDSWDTQIALCWDFLFAVAYNHPKTIKMELMPGCTIQKTQITDECQKNKWNILPMKERMKWFIAFWTYLPDVLPVQIANKWKQIRIRPDLQGRHSTLAWLWKMRCALDSQFKDPYTSICKRIASYSSNCNSNTCRKSRKSFRQKTHKKKQY